MISLSGSSRNRKHIFQTALALAIIYELTTIPRGMGMTELMTRLRHLIFLFFGRGIQD